ncbi:hypothetical protein HK102_005582 [Quaeritorhiza haematococci]|nr:hypothetical protein HK102_005582 [Quaeritorhiza haematococci]
MSKVQLYSDIFEVTDVDPHGKKFDKGVIFSRIVATSENIDMELTLDINSEIYPMSAAEKFTIVLATSITDGGPNDREAWRDVSASAATNAGTGRGATAVTSKKTLADDFDYVMHGKVFKFDDTGGSKV